MAINKALIQQLQDYKSALIDNGIQTESFYLFGSWAKEKQTKESDIDVAIVSKNFSGNRFYDSIKAAKIRQSINLQIEPITFRPEDFNDNDPLVDQIKNYGIKI